METIENIKIKLKMIFELNMSNNQVCKNNDNWN